MWRVIDGYLVSDPIEVWSDEPIDATAVLTSPAYDAGGKQKLMCFMKADDNTGTSHIKLSALLSFDGINFYAPKTGSDGQIIADFSGTTMVWVAFTLPACKKFKFVATGLGNGSTNGADIDFYLTFIGQA